MSRSVTIESLMGWSWGSWLGWRALEGAEHAQLLLPVALGSADGVSVCPLALSHPFGLLPWSEQSPP